MLNPTPPPTTVNWSSDAGYLYEFNVMRWCWRVDSFVLSHVSDEEKYGLTVEEQPFNGCLNCTRNLFICPGSTCMPNLCCPLVPCWALACPRNVTLLRFVRNAETGMVDCEVCRKEGWHMGVERSVVRNVTRSLGDYLGDQRISTKNYTWYYSNLYLLQDSLFDNAPPTELNGSWQLGKSSFGGKPQQDMTREIVRRINAYLGHVEQSAPTVDDARCLFFTPATTALIQVTPHLP